MGTTLTSKNVKIRKDRVCFSCWRKYERGSIMHYWSGICDGDFISGYNCLTCNEIMVIVQQQGYDEDGFPEGFVHESLDKGQTPEEYLLSLHQPKIRP